MVAQFLLIVGVTLILYAFYKWVTLNNEHFVKRGISYMKPYFLFGNTGGFLARQYRPQEYVTMLYNKFPEEKIFGLFDFRKPFYFIRDPDTIKQMAIKDFDYFLNHRTFLPDNSDRLFSNSLFMMKDDKWRDMRTTLSPAFTGSKMRQMFELVVECAAEMANHFVKAAKPNSKVDVEMKEIFSRYTNDVIASCAFGIKTDSFLNKENEFYLTGKRMMNFNRLGNVFRIFLLRAAPKIMKLLDVEFIDKNIHKFFQSMVLDTMTEREKQSIRRPDMINILMQIKKGTLSTGGQQEETVSADGFSTVEEIGVGKHRVKQNWSDDEIVAQCFIFFVAGFDTSSTLLSFAAHELAVNQDIQQKLYAEILSVQKSLGDKRLSYDLLQKMTYLDMVISESLRKWPPAILTDRVCVKDYPYDDGEHKFTIEKGSSFWIPIYALHHDPKYYPNPEKFDPERFSEENKDKINVDTYMPFGTGPRNCIGSRFALMETKAILYYLLLNFSFIPNEKTQIPIKLKKNPFGVISEKGINLSLKLRN